MASECTRVRLQVVPGARTPGVVGRHGDGWKVRVAAARERGKANDALLDLLARTLDVPRRDVALVSGHSGRDKIVELNGITPDDIERRFASAGRKE